MTYDCTVCGYDGLDEPAWKQGAASFEICPCCGIQFGYEDLSASARESWRAKWIAGGMVWWSARPAPENWSPTEQLGKIEQK